MSEFSTPATSLQPEAQGSGRALPYSARQPCSAGPTLRQQLLSRTQQQADQLAVASPSLADAQSDSTESLPADSPLLDTGLPFQIEGESSGAATPVWASRRNSGASSCEPRSPASPSAQCLERWGSSPRAAVSLHHSSSQCPPGAPPPTPATPGTPASNCTPKAGVSRTSSIFAPRSWSNSATPSQHSSAAPSRAASGKVKLHCVLLLWHLIRLPTYFMCLLRAWYHP